MFASKDRVIRFLVPFDVLNCVWCVELCMMWWTRSPIVGNSGLLWLSWEKCQKKTFSSKVFVWYNSVGLVNYLYEWNSIAFFCLISDMGSWPWRSNVIIICSLQHMEPKAARWHQKVERLHTSGGFSAHRIILQHWKSGLMHRHTD